MGIKIAALLLVLEGQRPGWIADVLGITRQSLNLWIHRVNDRV
jgi:transposase-like protein